MLKLDFILNEKLLFDLKEEEEESWVFEMPRSWVSCITISKKGIATPHEYEFIRRYSELILYVTNQHRNTSISN